MNRALEFFSYYGTLEPQSSEYNICKSVLDHLDKIETMSAAQLAVQSFTSEPTIRRFCKRLGYDSFSAFKRDLTLDYREVEVINSVVLKMHDNASDSISDLFDKSVKTLATVHSLFDAARIEKLKALKSRAGNVRIYSATPLSYVPLLTTILHAHGEDVKSPLFLYHQREDLMTLGENSLVIILGDPRLIDSAYGEQIKLAHKKGVKFCLCLNEATSCLSKYASVDFSFNFYKPCGPISLEVTLGAIMRIFLYDS